MRLEARRGRSGLGGLGLRAGFIGFAGLIDLIGLADLIGSTDLIGLIGFTDLIDFVSFVSFAGFAGFLNAEIVDGKLLRGEETVHKLRVQRRQTLHRRLHFTFSSLSHFGNPAQEQLSPKLLHRAELLILHVERQIAFNMEQTIQNRHIRKLVQSTIEMAELRHFQKLDSNSLSRHFDRQKMLDFWNSSRFKDAGVYRAIEARGKADGSKETQRIFSEGFNGRKRSSDKTIMQIRNASHREILDRSRVHVVKEAIDGQIATVRIFQRSSDRNGGNAAGVVIFLLAEVYKVNVGVDNASSSRFQML